MKFQFLGIIKKAKENLYSDVTTGAKMTWEYVVDKDARKLA
jgi:hypothetical protein